MSPDSHWIAYVSDDSGRREVYVTSFPDGVGRWQVSTAGGETPHWRRGGKELFFTSGEHFMAVDVLTIGQEFSVGAPHTLFDVRVPAPAIGTRSTYAVSPDGERFLFNTWDRNEALAPITLVVNWPQALKK